MRTFVSSLMMLAAMVVFAGCSPSPEANTPAPKDTAAPKAAAAPKPAAAAVPASAPKLASTPAPAAAPATTVKLPEEFTKTFHVNPEITLKTAETTDAAKAQYKVTGELRASPKEVMDYYVKYFKEHGWEEDAVMDQKSYTVVSYKKGGYLEYVDTHEGGIGVIVTITTGRS